MLATWWIQTYPGVPSNSHTITVNHNAVTENVNFGNRALGVIIGTVWHDVDADQTIDSGEPRLPGWTVTLYAADGTTVLAKQLAGPTGGYRFEDLAPGTYWVSETLGGPEWSNTTPIKLKVVLVEGFPGEIFMAIADFGNDKPFLPYTPDLPYTGGLYYQAQQPMTVHAEGSSAPRQGNEWMLLTALATGILGLLMMVAGRRKRQVHQTHVSIYTHR